MGSFNQLCHQSTAGTHAYASQTTTRPMRLGYTGALEPVVLVVSGMRAGGLCAVATGDRAIGPTAPTMPLAVCLTKGVNRTPPHQTAIPHQQVRLHIENDKNDTFTE
eukprot:2079000-Amphidinium_carterae.1